MIWLILALIGAGSFFVTGFNLLTDPLCISADFGGGRVVQVTCRSDEFGTVTGIQAGLISILIGLGILTLIFWRPLKAIYIQNKLLKIENSDYNFQKIDEKSQQSTTKNEVKKCPKCAEDIKAEAIKCRFCGSDLGPKGSEKTAQLANAYLKKYLNGNYAFQIIAISLVLLAVLIVGFINISHSREISALKESGQICVETSDGTSKFGCADYPQLKFNFCYIAPVYLLFFPDMDYRNLIDNDSSGRIPSDRGCYGNDGEKQYYFYVDTQLMERIGDYRISAVAYSDLTTNSYLEGQGFSNLVARISLKP
jgi:hypothetical protein